MLNNLTGGVDPQEFRQTLGRFASGVTIITAQDGQERRGMTASAFLSVSMTPPLVLVSVDRRAHMHGLLESSAVTHYGVSILAQDQQHLSDHFAGRPGPEEQVPWENLGAFQ
ncbi:flavin reductase family protein [Deinococcus lacus]|uniref:Flavin reductase family protein n=1 Tax=Deinococcus lacus TaxID=392561 RepID=A0ABW1YBM7_9DEIO